MARAHQLAPLAYYQLYHTLDRLPPWVAEALQTAYHNVLAANVVLYNRTQRILKALRQASIPVLVLKGTLFAQTLYPSIGARPMCDLDLVIPLDQLAQVETVLSSFGYRSLGHGTRPLEYHLRYGGEVTYGPPQSWPPVDLHWHLIFGEWPRWATAVADEDFWGRAEPAIIDGIEVLQLAVLDSLLHQVWHIAVVHGYTDMGLRSYVDLDRIIRAAGDSLDWTGFVELTRRVRMTTAAYLTLALCVQSLHTPVPPTVLATVQPSALRRRLLDQVLDQEALLQRRYVSRRRVYLLRLLLVDRTRDAARLLFRTFFPEKEWLAARYGLEDRGPRFAQRLRHLVLVLLLRGEI
ncbi:MAG: nucleotidyltransferase family protein [Chloroflexi bacterium]|nr:nucleotidyltransferase family protein [Chloroflexota bacterium]MBU1749943.1 nucleotidyltransferase family protein [Chloroflexota bacterium]